MRVNYWSLYHSKVQEVGRQSMFRGSTAPTNPGRSTCSLLTYYNSWVQKGGGLLRPLEIRVTIEPPSHSTTYTSLVKGLFRNFSFFH
ncbi:hypothetical protein GDO78_007105 [Eleutherodactylus coqui]|uniref:Uncharacterized protein n=1 Tax=Eleutherodactylus coqui TaxID=57060 RepID=A0A8J6FHX6_ELECQ|nr:hypothetical protein GDO78_007105 [Eleutherodactylus coqui]